MRQFVVLAILAALSGCGGAVDLTCEDEEYYMRATEGRRVAVPEDLDSLEPLREMPLPEASPRSPRSPDSPCIDRPPEIDLTS